MRLSILLIVVLLSWGMSGYSQAKPYRLEVTVQNDIRQPLANATVTLIRAKDSSIVKSAVTNNLGVVVFEGLPAAQYQCKASLISYEAKQKTVISIDEKSINNIVVILSPSSEQLQDVTVVAKKPFVQMLPDKTVVNVDAGITNAGTSVMDVLEKSPGVTIDRDGNISLKGRSGVQVMIDGKLTLVSGNDLANLLNGMNASQVDQIELIDNPSAKYDAAGNAGLINIKTKRNKQKGFNGTVTLALGQGRYPKRNANILLNYRSGNFNFFVNYGHNATEVFLEMYAKRTQFKESAKINTESILEQPFYNKIQGQTHNLRTGMDYYLSKKTIVGFSLNGNLLKRENQGSTNAKWINANGNVDSTIFTQSDNNTDWRNGGINLNARHVVNQNKEISADVDYLRYRIRTDQYFENQLNSSGTDVEANMGNIPSDLEILSGKVDFVQRFSGLQWESGWKSSHINTDNFAQYFFRQNSDWVSDLGKTNHFLYTENIHALYTNFSGSKGRWDLQSGLRYEYTGYRGNQLGNAVVKDSSFTRNYHNLFPSLFVTYKLDSNNSVGFRAGRRIDRPPFQKLNPFSAIINKYTYQRGNPLILPQYTWNLEVSYLFKQMINASFSYNYTNDYFSQIFFPDSTYGANTIIYSDGNVGKMQNFGLTVGAQLNPTKWWSFNTQANFTHKKLRGVLWREYTASISQFNVNINNQFRFKKGWSAELTGFYIGRSQNDLQEVLEPTGQLSAGVSKQVLKGKGTVRLTFRDIFWTQQMAGLTHFEFVEEYFRLMRDTRVATISFTYRFGKTMKQTVKRSNGADDEINRVGNGN